MREYTNEWRRNDESAQIKTKFCVCTICIPYALSVCKYMRYQEIVSLDHEL